MLALGFKLLFTIIMVVFAIGQWKEDGLGIGLISVMYTGALVWIVWETSLAFLLSPDGELGLF